jgi:hypothetical protein
VYPHDSFSTIRYRTRDTEVNTQLSNRQAVHGGEDALKVGALERQQAAEGLAASLRCLRHNHLAHSLEPLVRREEHVLGAHESDALRAVAASLGGVLGGVRIREHLRAEPQSATPRSRRRILHRSHLDLAALVHP